MILDSGPLIAMLNRKDRHHKLAGRFLRGASRGAIVPDPVVVEVEIGVRRRMGPPVARGFLEIVSAGAHVRMPLTDALWRRAVEIDARYADLNLGLVDASVMAVAEARGEPVFTFDFRAFRGVPGPDNGAWQLVVTEADLR
ncbi:MAG: type II toxin-antitoxin system VapC family toxin [Egibacteraceae bacterium]